MKTKTMKKSMSNSPSGAPKGTKPGSAGAKAQKTVAPTHSLGKSGNNIPKSKTATKGK